MVHGRKIIAYTLDLIYGASQYPCGWLKPQVVKGYFPNNESGKLQRLFFDGLLNRGFKRTHWQLVFPDQTAGLIKRFPPDSNGIDEYHVRFYNDGVIDCELEVNRFNGWHWKGARQDGAVLLDNLLSGFSEISLEERQKIKEQFGTKPYSDYCVRK